MVALERKKMRTNRKTRCFGSMVEIEAVCFESVSRGRGCKRYSGNELELAVLHLVSNDIRASKANY
jgi:hypothetical protein